MASLVLPASGSESRSPSSRSAASTFASASTEITTPSSMATLAPVEEDPTIWFTTVDELFNQINRTLGDTLVVTNVSPRKFTAIERKRESSRRKFRFRYHASSQILIITIPTHIHEQLHHALYIGEFIHQISRMGLGRNWKSIGAATRRRGGDSGEGDSTGGPKPQRTGRTNWPTLVIEAGESESLNRLHEGMEWWFAASNHDVKIVILAKFYHGGRSRILLEKWEEQLQAPTPVPVPVMAARPGARTRSVTAAIAAAAAAPALTLAPVLRQSITITQDATANPPSYNVASGALTLDFHLLFLRAPGPGEGDIVFSIQDLQGYAESVFEV